MEWVIKSAVLNVIPVSIMKKKQISAKKRKLKIVQNNPIQISLNVRIIL